MHHSVFARSHETAGKSNQDVHKLIVNVDGTTCAVVADGHGTNGRLIAELAIKYVETWTFTVDLNKLHESGDLTLEIEKMYHLLNVYCREILVMSNPEYYIDDNGAVRDQNGKVVGGGTTLSCCWIFKDSNNNTIIHSANVGDSEIVLIDIITGSFIHLSEDHSASNPREFMRLRDRISPSLKLVYHLRKPDILWIDPSSFPSVFLPNGEFNEESKKTDGVYRATLRIGELATYAIGPETQIAMTRAIGDYVANKFGLIDVPCQKTHVLDNDTNYVLTVCSDGIWDLYDYSQFAQYVVQNMSSNNIDILTESIMSNTMRLGKAVYGEGNLDDATIVNLYIQKSG